MDTLKKKSVNSMADFEALKDIAGKSSEPDKTVEQTTREELERFNVEPLAVVLPAGWKLGEWRQKHMIAIYEDGPLQGALDGTYSNRWRRNGELVKSVLAHDGFDGLNISDDNVDNMDWRDVEQIALAIVAHYQNAIIIKKK